MACGLPVVATAVDSLPEIVAPGETGLLVQPGDSKQMAAAILEIMDNPWRGQHLGLAGRAAVIQRLSIERMIVEYAQLYRELMPS
jgi:glycosyltransferase involved in cell wall biosynthesis